MKHSVAFAVLLASVATIAHGDFDTPKLDRRPPKFADKYLQYLEPRFYRAFIDAKGDAWLLLRDYGDASSGKVPDQVLIHAHDPARAFDIPARNIVLGFDRQGRFWEIGRFGLVATDTNTGVSIERKAAPEARIQPPNLAGGGNPRGFAVTMVEHPSGRLYFADGQGVHVLTGDDWQYERLLEGDPTAVQAAGGLRVQLGPDGLVWVDALKTRREVIAVHDGKTWRKFSEVEHASLRWGYEIRPLESGVIELVTLDRRPARLQVLKKEEAPTPAAKADSRQSTPTLRGGPLAAPGRYAGTDGLGRHYYACDTGVFYSTPRLAVVDERFAPKEMLAASAHAINETTGGRAVVVDEGGVLWARLSVVERPSLSRWTKGAWEHLADPAPPVLAADEMLWMDGDNWRRRRHDAPFDPMHSGWPKEFRGVPAMANPSALMTLKEGALLAIENEGRAFFYQNGAWESHDGLGALVEARYGRLKELWSNTAPFWGERRLAGMDNGGRIWILTTKGGLGARTRVWDGEAWKGGQSFVAFNADGTRMAGREGLYDTSQWPPTKLAEGSGYSKVVTDGQRFRRPDMFKAESYVKHVGNGDPWFDYSYTDKHGRIWNFGRPRGGGVGTTITPVDEEGQPGMAYTHAMRCHSHVFQAEGFVWVLAADGLLQLRLEGKGAKAKLVLVKHHQNIIAPDSVNWMGVDGEGGLWFTVYRAVPGLYRVTLPRKDGGEKK